jgi:hypothetical protein
MSAPPGQTLPAKESAIFKTIVVRDLVIFSYNSKWKSYATPGLQKFYESKQYKKGIKAAETILKKFPDHG